MRDKILHLVLQDCSSHDSTYQSLRNFGSAANLKFVSIQIIEVKEIAEE